MTANAPVRWALAPSRPPVQARRSPTRSRPTGLTAQEPCDHPPAVHRGVPGPDGLPGLHRLPAAGARPGRGRGRGDRARHGCGSGRPDPGSAGRRAPRGHVRRAAPVHGRGHPVPASRRASCCCPAWRWAAASPPSCSRAMLQGAGIAMVLPSALSLVPRMVAAARVAQGLSIVGAAQNLTLVLAAADLARDPGRDVARRGRRGRRRASSSSASCWASGSPCGPLRPRPRPWPPPAAASGSRSAASGRRRC